MPQFERYFGQHASWASKIDCNCCVLLNFSVIKGVLQPLLMMKQIQHKSNCISEKRDVLEEIGHVEVLAIIVRTVTSPGHAPCYEGTCSIRHGSDETYRYF